MPMPKPRKDEDHEAFINRCMGDPIMVGDFPDTAQRYAVCQQQWQPAANWLLELSQADTKAITQWLVPGLVTQAEIGRDPTRTVKLRQRYTRALTKRFEAIIKEIKTLIIDEDFFDLDRNSITVIRTQAHPARPSKFDFTTDAARRVGFMQWLNDLIDDEVLEVLARDGERITDYNPWFGTYVDQAYVRGVVASDTIAKRAGFDIPSDPLFGEATVSGMFNAPVHSGTLEVLYTRQFELLRGITEEMSTQIGAALAQGIGSGITNDDIAALINDRVNKIGITRAKLIARTEVINAYSEATLNRYSQYGITEVVPLVEFATAGDERVCIECAAIEGKVYTTQNARGLIPVHPNCRCAWLPYIFPSIMDK